MSTFAPPPAPGGPWQTAPPTRAVAAAPPLSARQARSAAQAGGWGLFLLTAGSGLLLVGLVALVFGAVVRFIPQASVNTGLAFVIDHLAAVVAGSLGALALGAGLLIGGVLICHRILHSAGHARPWAVTAAGEGIAVAALTVASTISSFGFSLVATPLSFALTPVEGALAADEVAWNVAFSIVSTVVTLVIATACGALSCWWMAVVLRGPRRDAVPGH